MGSFLSAATHGAHPLADILGQHHASLQPQFQGGAGALGDFFHVNAAAERMEEISSQLREHDAVAAAFLKPWPEPHIFKTLAPTADPPPNATPDFTVQHGYLDAAPNGIDARFAWNYPGGAGDGIQIIDIEGAWQITHENLTSHQNGLAGGVALVDDFQWRNHGTAVLGIITGNRNGFGVSGIAPDADVRMISLYGDDMDCAKAVFVAAQLLSPGDILLLESQQRGPGDRFIAMEWWPDTLAAIQYATARGIIVVEPAGNGGVSLDDPIYDRHPASPLGPFPDSWSNPFRRSDADSGAILVGAGAPPRGMHGHDHGDDRSRLPMSNYGSAVDCQGWGHEVTTCGYGDLQGGASEDRWYTNNFNGTSSAAPMVAAALACVQGALRASGRSQLGPLAARQLLRATGSPQPDPQQRIGNLPDLREILLRLVGEPQI
jgi:hypothetical protein